MRDNYLKKYYKKGTFLPSEFVACGGTIVWCCNVVWKRNERVSMNKKNDLP